MDNRIQLYNKGVETYPAIGEQGVSISSDMQIVEAAASKAGFSYGNSVLPHKKLVVAHISDLHGDSARFQRFSNFIESYKTIDFGLLTGDIIERYNDSISFFTGDSGQKVIYPVVGNHEGVGYNSTGFNTFINNKLFTPIASKLPVVNQKNYYYKDITTFPKGNSTTEFYTIRFIFLNQYDYPDDFTTPNYPYCIYSQQQINWLIETLQDCNENGYYAIIVSHTLPDVVIPNTSPFFTDIPWDNFTQNLFNGSLVSDIVNAYKHGSSLSQTYTATESGLPDITVNTSFSNNGKFIAHINGHTHNDMVGYDSVHNDQLILNVANGLCPNNESWGDLPRQNDDETQDCYNIYVFDLDNKNVHVVRIGASLNFKMKSRKYCVYSF